MNKNYSEIERENSILSARVIELEAELQQMHIHKKEVDDRMQEFSRDQHQLQQAFLHYKQDKNKTIQQLYELIANKDKQNCILMAKFKAAQQNKQDYQRILLQKNRKIGELTTELRNKQQFIIKCLESPAVKFSPTLTKSHSKLQKDKEING